MVKSKIRDAVISELLELDALDNEDEAERRREFLSKILVTVLDYEQYIIEYDCNSTIQSFCDRGIEFSPVENTAQIKQEWDEIFTNEIDMAKKDEIFYNDFKWHIFSYKVLDSVEKDSANASFLNSKKSNVYIFFQHSDKCYRISNCHLFEERDITNPKILDFISDFYVFDTVEKWTYVCTHEDNCGPYFYQVK